MVSDWWASRRAVEAVLRTGRPALDDALAALALVSELRADVDAVERQLLGLARERGASWRDVAAALGLRSRQAAEQRWLRLLAASTRDPAAARERRRRQRIVDVGDQDVTALRAQVTALQGRLERRRDRNDPHGALVHLARQTLQVAADAPAGALHDLVRHAVSDLRAIPAPVLGHSISAVVERLSALAEGANLPGAQYRVSPPWREAGESRQTLTGTFDPS